MGVARKYPGFAARAPDTTVPRTGCGNVSAATWRRAGVSRGRFITLEGGEGAGKTTQSARLVEALAQRDHRSLRTREPGGAPGAELLRGILLGGSIDWSPQAETLLHFAARAEHVAKTIRPALDAGTWVVCDRFYDSTLAYQGYGQGADRSSHRRTDPPARHPRRT